MAAIEDVTFELDVLHPETLVFLKSQWAKVLDEAALEMPIVLRDLANLRNSFRAKLHHLHAEGLVSAQDAAD